MHSKETHKQKNFAPEAMPASDIALINAAVASLGEAAAFETRERLMQLVDDAADYGGDLSLWPSSAAHEARALMADACQPVADLAADILAGAAELEDFFQEIAVAPVSDELMARMLADAQANLPTDQMVPIARDQAGKDQKVDVSANLSRASSAGLSQTGNRVIATQSAPNRPAVRNATLRQSRSPMRQMAGMGMRAALFAASIAAGLSIGYFAPDAATEAYVAGWMPEHGEDLMVFAELSVVDFGE